MSSIIHQIASELNVKTEQITAAVELLTRAIRFLSFPAIEKRQQVVYLILICEP